MVSTRTDKHLERDRYDQRAVAQLEQGVASRDAVQTGIEAISPVLRSPYERYYAELAKVGSEQTRILEIGSGTGAHTGVLLATGSAVMATDISPNSLEVLKHRYQQFGSKLETQVADMEQLPFGDAEFDLVCSAGSLSYGDTLQVRDEIHRVLKPGGRFICVDSLHENPVYKVNRWIGYWRGKRTRSTIERMPTIRTISNYEPRFVVEETAFFGAISFLSPLLGLLLSAEKVRQVSDRFDALIQTRRSAFKFIMVARKV